MKRVLYFDDNEIAKSSEPVIYFLYHSFLESILQKEDPSREEIKAVETFQHNYNIPFEKHLVYLDGIEDGLVKYTSYLERFDLMTVGNEELMLRIPFMRLTSIMGVMINDDFW